LVYAPKLLSSASKNRAPSKTHVTVICNVVDAVPAGPVYDAVAVYGPTSVIGLNCGDVHLLGIPLESVCVAVYVSPKLNVTVPLVIGVFPCITIALNSNTAPCDISFAP